MCGITATYIAQPEVPLEHDVLEKQIQASMKTIHHRGPDSTGTYVSEDGRVGLGHTRLSIIDVEGGQQPLHHLDNTIHAIVNGELYDYDRLRQELELKGAVFQTNSDSELVVHLYKAHGINLVHHLRGEFAFILYDSTRKRLFAARDRFGIKPVYYTLVNGRLMIGSEVKTFLAYGWKPEWDVQSIREGGEWNDNRTAFRGVFKLLGGHQLQYSLSGQLRIQPYWEQKFPNAQTPDTRTVEEVIEGVRERLVDAVRVRLRSDVPLAIALSGGVDSSGVAGIATKVLREKDPNAKVVTFTLSFPERKDLDEGPFAQRMAESIGAEIHMITPSEEDLANKFSTVVINSEMAVSAMHAPGKYILSEAVRKAGYKVVLTGEGADEVHGGYAYLLTDYLRAPDPAGASMGLELPTPAELESILKVVEGTRPAQDQIPVGTMSYTDQQLGRSMVGGISSGRVWGTSTTPEFVFHPKAIESLSVTDAATVISENVRPEARRHMANGDWHPLHSALYVSAIAMLPLLLNQLGDRAEMASSVEGRQPYLDTALVEYMNNAPPSLKVKPFKDENGQWKFTEKWLLRQAVKPFITEEIFYRKKDQYNSPAINRKNKGKYTPVQALIHEHVNYEKVEKLGFLNWTKVKEMLDGYLENPEYPQDGGLDKRARALLQISSYTILGNLFNVPTAVF